MPAGDNLTQFQTLTTVTATANGTAVNTINGSAIRDMYAEILVPAASVGTVGTAAQTVQFSADISADNTTFRQYQTTKLVTLTTAVASFTKNMKFAVPSGEPYVRISANLAGNATGVSVAYSVRGPLDSLGTGGQF